MKVAVAKETQVGERRVALVPDGVARLSKAGVEVVVEAGAGERAFLTDQAFVAAGARLVPNAAALQAEADVLLKVQPPSLAEVEQLREGTTLISFLPPQASLDLIRRLAERRITAFSLELVPRSTKAQGMDALSSMSTIAGYKGVLLAAVAQPRLFPLMVTAAGTLAPARVLIIGAGVAGLQAIATARRLGAIVQAFDVRAATKEHVESLGATFLQPDLKDEKAETTGGYARELSREAQDRNLETIGKALKETDVVISTAQVPGKPAPRLITERMVKEMRPGSVIVDLATESGGNCELAEAGKEIERHRVIILGPVNVASSVPFHASSMFSRNVSTLLLYLLKDGRLSLDFSDEIVKAMCLTHEGSVVHELPKKLLEPMPAGVVPQGV